MSSISWAILTGEFPPKLGGVSDYSHQVASALAHCGDRVQVFSCGFGLNDLMQIAHEIDQLGPRTRVLVQYVPHAFGMHAMNLPLCIWLRRHRNRWNIDVMFHEVMYPISPTQPLRHNFLGQVNRTMAKLVARSARRIFISTKAWERLLRAMIDNAMPLHWLPVPSNLPIHVDESAIAAVRKKLTPRNEILIGHFGDRGKWIAQLLFDALHRLSREDRRIVLIGKDNQRRFISTDALPADQTTAHIAACDLMIQPYSDGISTRRSSAMAALALGRPVVSAIGPASESIWRESGGVALADSNDAGEIASLAERLLADPSQRAALALRGRKLYDDHFALDYTIRALRENF